MKPFSITLSFLVLLIGLAHFHGAGDMVGIALCWLVTLACIMGGGK